MRAHGLEGKGCCHPLCAVVPAGGRRDCEGSTVFHRSRARGADIRDTRDTRECPMTDEPSARDDRGRWCKGFSGHREGRPRGSKNRYPRRRADRGRASKWTRHDWAVVYRRTLHETDGDAGQKHAAAFSECMALWLLLNPPAQRAGLCTYCGKPLDAPKSSVDGAPLRVEGCWTHFGCARFFLRQRWDEARFRMEQLGIGPASI
jgi:hypothetical protein